MSTLGAKDQPQETQEHVTIALEIMDHHESRGFLASNENPQTSLLFKREDWKKVVGSLCNPIWPWSHAELCGCLAKVKYPGVERLNEPMRKGQIWTSNFDLRAMSMSCENPRAALFPTDHEHVHVRGSCKTVENKWISVAAYSGMYTGVQGTLYGQCLKKALVDVRTKGG
jgi:hypothetical protein